MTSSDRYHNPNFESSNSAYRFRYDLTKRDQIFNAQMNRDTVDGEYDVMGNFGATEKIQLHRIKPLLSNTDESPLSRTFFSKENIQILQNAIRAEVYRRTGKVIAEQNYRELLIVMRSIYFLKAVESEEQIRKQIQFLNSLVLKDVVQPIITKMELYEYYLKNQGKNPLPENLPEATSVKGRITLEYNPAF